METYLYQDKQAVDVDDFTSDHFIDFPVNQMYRPVGELRQSFIMGYDNKRLSETVT